MALHTGTVTKVSSKNGGSFTIHESDGPPPVDTVFTPCSDKDLIVASGAFGHTVEVDPGDGFEPPHCDSVTRT